MRPGRGPAGRERYQPNKTNMKNIRKIALLAVLGAVVMTSCREDETVDLAGYPSTNVGMGIEGQEPGVTSVPLKATYDAEGAISVSGDLTRTYTFQLASPSPEDLTLKLEPIIVNIPADKVEISATELHIPAGSKSADPVTVTFLDPDFSFAGPDPEAKTYELGVRVAKAEGYDPQFEGGNEAKVVVEKDAYVAHFSIRGSLGNYALFTRSYAKGKILNTDPMTVSFRVLTDRPVLEDTQIAITSEGVPEAFKDDETIAPAVLTIPAGAKESSEYADWTLTDDLLLTNAEAEEYGVLLKMAAVAENPNVAPAESDQELAIQIKKELYIANLSIASASNSRAVEFRRSYVDGQIMNETPMSFQFRAKLNRPALEEVKVVVSMEGLPDGFADDVTITPAELTIPVGASESDLATWTMTDDFLLTDDVLKDFAFKLNAAPKVEDPTIKPVEGQMAIGIIVKKVADLLSFVDGIDPAWTKHSPAGWVGTPLSSAFFGSVNELFDGGMYTDFYTRNSELSFSVDMLESKKINGVVIRAYDNSANNHPVRFVLSTSDDGATWTEYGELQTSQQNQGVQYVAFLKPVTARYIRYQGYGKQGTSYYSYIDLSEFEVYGTN